MESIVNSSACPDSHLFVEIPKGLLAGMAAVTYVTLLCLALLHRPPFLTFLRGQRLQS
jgi:hypothetical protein